LFRLWQSQLEVLVCSQLLCLLCLEGQGAMANVPHAGEDLSEFDQEELDIRGSITFKQALEVLPKTTRTEELQKERFDDLEGKTEVSE